MKAAKASPTPLEISFLPTAINITSGKTYNTKSDPPPIEILFLPAASNIKSANLLSNNISLPPSMCKILFIPPPYFE